SIVSLVIAPSLAQIHKTDASAQVPNKIESITTEKRINASTVVKKISDTVIETDNGGETLIAALKKDGIVSGNNISINIKGDNITVNGKELSPELVKKYQQYLPHKEN
ncbi:MAG: hypothetical protein H7101_07045, partial [Deinococcales bacterium]|nr:hypothetical protein [Chitinophagaceae bacterium]